MEVRVAIGMVADVVSFFPHAYHDIGVLLGGPSYYKKRSLNCVIPKNVQNPRSVNWIWPVIDCDGNLRPVPIPMLEQLPVGHGAV